MTRRTRAQMEAAILAAGRTQLRERGAAALSLREVAREVGVVSSAVYRYVDSRDELLTRLLVDAFDGLADAVDDALSEVPGDGPGVAGAAARLGTLARSVRAWGVAHPAEWGLLYGTPVPGFAASPDRTGGPGTRVMARVLELVAAGGLGDVPTGRDDVLVPFAREAVAELGVDASADEVAAAMTWWAGLVGLVSAQVFGAWGPVPDGLGEALLERWLGGAAGAPTEG
ncbi:TetR/AcrR family transcriptional regulator [Kytococcus schroeteri]|uniref:TetR/AcrR family transcriptional regulator n=1 Tax=Kytococcus schroeteri TaxID=138300 RepID=UPI0035E79593